MSSSSRARNILEGKESDLWHCIKTTLCQFLYRGDIACILIESDRLGQTSETLRLQPRTPVIAWIARLQNEFMDFFLKHGFQICEKFLLFLDFSEKFRRKTGEIRANSGKIRIFRGIRRKFWEFFVRKMEEKIGISRRNPM